jgi:hypothetical protein
MCFQTDFTPSPDTCTRNRKTPFSWNSAWYREGTDLIAGMKLVEMPRAGARVLAMSLFSDYENEEETRILAESFGAVRILDKAKLCDELIPAILGN